VSALRDRVALVTGAGSGIGKSLALALLESGARVAACGRGMEKLEQLLSDAGDGSSRLLTASVDVRDGDHLRAFAEKTAMMFGTVDTLIANAGMGIFQPVQDMPPDVFDDVIDVNLRGVFLSVKAVLPQMLEAGAGDVVIVGSLASKNGFAGGAAYTAAKFGVRGLAQSMMFDLREKGIRVMTIFPGSVDTDFFDDTQMNPNRDKILQATDVTDAVMTMLCADRRAMISELDIRPSNPR
jgi:NADP-dependent 3-hydroxy acid dehydrogenase YdfG